MPAAVIIAIRHMTIVTCERVITLVSKPRCLFGGIDRTISDQVFIDHRRANSVSEPAQTITQTGRRRHLLDETAPPTERVSLGIEAN